MNASSLTMRRHIRRRWQYQLRHCLRHQLRDCLLNAKASWQQDVFWCVVGCEWLEWFSMASSYHHNFTKTNLVFGIIASSKQSLFLASSYHQNKACFTFHRIIKTTLVSSKQGLFHTSSYHQNNACLIKTTLVSSKQGLFTCLEQKKSQLM